LIIITLVLSLSGCCDITDFFKPNEFKISNARIEDNILVLEMEVWVRSIPFTSFDVLRDNGLSLWFNGKEFEYWGLDLPKDFRDRNAVDVYHNYLRYTLGKYGDEAIYERDNVITDSKPPGYWGVRDRNHAYLTMYFLIENTTLRPPILIEIKNKEGKVIDSTEVSE
jgi:hypothetical protein